MKRVSQAPECHDAIPNAIRTERPLATFHARHELDTAGLEQLAPARHLVACGGQLCRIGWNDAGGQLAVEVVDWTRTARHRIDGEIR